MNIVKLVLSFSCSSNNYRQKSIPTCSVFLSSVLTATDRQLIGRLWVRDSNTLRPVFTKCQWLIWSISINVCVISDQLGLQPILEQLTWFIKKSKQFNQNNITGDMIALAPTLNINGPLPLYLSKTSSWSWISRNIKTFKTIHISGDMFSMSAFFQKRSQFAHLCLSQTDVLVFMGSKTEPKRPSPKHGNFQFNYFYSCHIFNLVELVNWSGMNGARP